VAPDADFFFTRVPLASALRALRSVFFIPSAFPDCRAPCTDQSKGLPAPSEHHR
jgi:hypothetical protein